MKAHIEIAMDNAAFDPSWETELARMLREIAKKLEGGTYALGHRYNLRDVNGNTVGKLVVTGER